MATYIYTQRDLGVIDGRSQASSRGSTHNDFDRDHDLEMNDISQKNLKPNPNVNIETEDEDQPGDLPSRTRKGLVMLEKKACKKERFYFKCFRHLHLYNIMYYQDELVKLEHSFDPEKPWTMEQMKRLSELLKCYNDALQIGQSMLSTDLVPTRYSSTVLAEMSKATSDPCYRLTQSPKRANSISALEHERLGVINIEMERGLLDGMDWVARSSRGSATLSHLTWNSDKDDRFVHRVLHRFVNHTWETMIKTRWPERLAFGIIAGSLLVGPMVALQNAHTVRAQIQTLSIAILVFICLMAITTRAGPQDIFSATAAYAAVFVVFVGVKLGPA